MTRPAAAGRDNPSAVTTWQTPTPSRAVVITHRSVAFCAARELIVSIVLS